MEKTRINFRIDKELKEEMEQTCREMGMSMSSALMLFCKMVVREKQIPFEVKMTES